MSLIRRFANLLRRDRLDADIAAELQSHLDLRTDANIAAGMSPEDALRAARMSLGNPVVLRERTLSADAALSLESIARDLRYALRQMRKAPGFTAVAVLTLALGIGANTVIFTVAKHALLDRLHVPHPEQLRLLAFTEPRDGVPDSFWGGFDTGSSTSFSYPVYQQLRARNHSLQDIFAFKNFGRMTVTANGQAEAVETEMVSGNYYSDLGVEPALGRAISEADDQQPGSGPVVILSDAFWSRRFGRSRSVIGRTVLVNMTPMTVIGVNPPEFTGTYGAQISPDIFLPFSMQPIVAPKGPHSLLTDNELWWVLVMGRARPGVSDTQAQAALNVVLRAAVRATMSVKSDAQLPSLVLRDGSRGQNEAASTFAKPIAVLMTLAGCVLLLACANLANLLLARGSARQREMSVRLAIGAGRRRILRQMFTESLLLAFFGGAAGLLLGFAVRNAIPRLLSSPWGAPAFYGSVDWGVFAFTAAVSLATAVVFGLVPAWQASRVQVSSGLKDSAQVATHRRRGFLNRGLVVLQISLSMLLLVGAGLFVRTLLNLRGRHLGFRPENILLVAIEPPSTRYAGGAGIKLTDNLQQKIAAVPGVQSVTLSMNPLLADYLANSILTLPGETAASGKYKTADMNIVGDHFLATMNIPLIAGRELGPQDTETSAKTVIINQALARQYFPGNPLGRTFSIGGMGDSRQTVTIVGVCADAMYADIQQGFPPTFYVPFRQQGRDFNDGVTFEITTPLKPEAILPGLRNAVRSIDPNLPLLDVRTQQEQIDATLQQQRIFADLTSGFGIIALVLACIGIYGMMAYSVARRVHEIGIRIALGALRAEVLRLVLWEAAGMTLIGVAAGVAGALALGRTVASLLFGLQSWDPETLIAAATLLAAVALAAAWFPARSAASIDPATALRSE